MTVRSSRWMWLVCAALAGASVYACEEKKTDTGGGTTAPSASASTTTASTASAAPSASASTVASADDDGDETAPSASAAPSGSTSAAKTATSASATKTAAGGFAPGTCGGKDQPKCPLQAWMAANMQPAMAANDATKLAAALRQSAKFAPPGYSDWAKIATDGAAAVESAKDAAAGKPACKSCHGEYQKRYRTEFRERPI